MISSTRRFRTQQGSQLATQSGPGKEKKAIIMGRNHPNEPCALYSAEEGVLLGPNLSGCGSPAEELFYVFGIAFVCVRVFCARYLLYLAPSDCPFGCAYIFPQLRFLGVKYRRIVRQTYHIFWPNTSVTDGDYHLTS